MYMNGNAQVHLTPLVLMVLLHILISAVECKELNHPPNGRVEFPVPSTYQSLAVYTCNTGYNLKGNDSRECLVDGVWSGMEPTCEGNS